MSGAGGAPCRAPPRTSQPLDPAALRDHLQAMANRHRSRAAAQGPRPSLQFSGINWILLIAGIASAALGYLLLSQGSITAAPLLLVLGYVVFMPLAIIL